MNGENPSLGGGTVSNELPVVSAVLCERECTVTRCVLQFAAVAEDVLVIGSKWSDLDAEVKWFNGGNSRSKDARQIMHVESRQTLGEQIPGMNWFVGPADIK